MATPKVWQGSLDMLCGVYCLAYLVGLHGRGGLRHATDTAFAHLLGSAEENGFLTAKRLTSLGFYDYQLSAVFNSLSYRRRFGLVATPFRSARFRRWHDATSGKTMIRQGATAVISERGDEHWIAVTGLDRDGDYACFDPSIEHQVAARERISWDQGVLIASEEHVSSLSAQTV